MTKILQRLLFLLSLSLVAVSPSISLAQQGAEPRTALVIGNAAYPFATLANPANDATDVANVLRGAGFDVTLKTDSDEQGMAQALLGFNAALKSKGGVGLFYFA